ncbi:hypothetical protein BBJ28_00025204, partial [Nothophytophthora sp. Chile5]
LTGSKDGVDDLDQVRARPPHRLKRKPQMDKENHSRQATVLDDEAAFGDDDDVYGEEDDGGPLDERPPFVVKKRRPVSILGHDTPSGSHADTETDAGANPKKKKRKGRLYCVCKGASFGNMIACDNKKCLDRSNWYHMGCVQLDPAQDPPETWFCPSCQENDPSEIPENPISLIDGALTLLVCRPIDQGTFKEICDFVETQYESQLNWKLESDQRKSPVWKSSVRKILFSNIRFRKHPEDKGLFCLAA